MGGLRKQSGKLKLYITLATCSFMAQKEIFKLVVIFSISVTGFSLLFRRNLKSFSLQISGRYKYTCAGGNKVNGHDSLMPRRPFGKQSRGCGLQPRHTNNIETGISTPWPGTL